MLSLLEALERRTFVSGPALATILGIDERRLRREIADLNAIDLGVRVAGHRGPRGGYSLARGDAMPPVILSAEEALAVVVAMRRLRREAHPWRLSREGDRSKEVAANAAVAEPLLLAADLVLSRIERLLPEPVARQRGLAERSVAVIAAELRSRETERDPVVKASETTA